MKSLNILLFIIGLAFSLQMNAQTVYTTKTGEKYHTKICHYLKFSKKEITLEKAIELGYKACKVCKPTKTIDGKSKIKTLQNKEASTKPEIPTKKTVATQCIGKTKVGKRCKRKTKNTSGRCYQH